MRRPLLVLFAVMVLLAAGCGDDEDAPAADSAPEVTTDNGEDITSEDDEEASRVATVADLALLLDEVEGGCALEYEGLTDDQREVSICTLGGEIAELSVWTDEGSLEGLVDGAADSGDPLVAGPNWSVDVVDPDLAEAVAEATGGTVHG